MIKLDALVLYVNACQNWIELTTHKLGRDDCQESEAFNGVASSSHSIYFLIGPLSRSLHTSPSLSSSVSSIVLRSRDNSLRSLYNLSYCIFLFLSSFQGNNNDAMIRRKEILRDKILRSLKWKCNCRALPSHFLRNTMFSSLICQSVRTVCMYHAWFYACRITAMLNGVHLESVLS